MGGGRVCITLTPHYQWLLIIIRSLWEFGLFFLYHPPFFIDRSPLPSAKGWCRRIILSLPPSILQRLERSQDETEKLKKVLIIV
jgi:hypothetical protein